MVIADKVHAKGGNKGGGANSTASDGADGTITLNSTGTVAGGNIDTSAANFDPDPPTINEEQAPVCECPA